MSWYSLSTSTSSVGFTGTGNNRAAPNASANAKVLIDLLFYSLIT